MGNETEECYRPQSPSKGGKHDPGTRWAKGQVGWEARSTSSCVCAMYLWVRLGLEMDALYVHILPALTGKAAQR